MPAVVTVLIVGVVLVALWFYFRSRSGGVAERSVPSAVPTQASALSQVDFKVKGSTAHVYFDTHIPEGGADDVLAGLMGREAMRIFEGKANHLPLEAVKHVAAHGNQAGETVEVIRLDVKRPVEMDHMDAPSADDVVLAGQVEALDTDPLGDIHAMEFGRSGGYRGGGDELAPLEAELEVPAKVAAAVAGAGGSLAGISVEDFISGLLKQAGYEVSLTGSGTGTARKGGISTFLQFVEHQAGSHPELADHSIDAFIVKFVSSGADRGMLFTPKFGPYAIYEKERHNDRVKFMTRERLQAFVDSVAMS